MGEAPCQNFSGQRRNMWQVKWGSEKLRPWVIFIFGTLRGDHLAKAPHSYLEVVMAKSRRSVREAWEFGKTERAWHFVFHATLGF